MKFFLYSFMNLGSHPETGSNLTLAFSQIANQMTGSHMKCNTELKWVKLKRKLTKTSLKRCPKETMIKQIPKKRTDKSIISCGINCVKVYVNFLSLKSIQLFEIHFHVIKISLPKTRLMCFHTSWWYGTSSDTYTNKWIAGSFIEIFYLAGPN